MNDFRLLVVEDEADQRTLLAGLLSAEGYSVACAASLAEATRELGRAPVDLVISDWRLPDGDGGELLARVRAHHPDVGFVMVTAYGTIARAVERADLPARVHCYGIPQRFLAHASRTQILEEIGLTPAAIADDAIGRMRA